MQRVRLRAAPRTWRAFSMTAVEGIPAPEVAQARDEDRPRLRGPQHDPAAIAGGVPPARGGAGRTVSRGRRSPWPIRGAISGTGTEAMPDCPPPSLLERFLAGGLDDPAARRALRARRGVSLLPGRARRPGRWLGAETAGRGRRRPETGVRTVLPRSAARDPVGPGVAPTTLDRGEPAARLVYRPGQPRTCARRHGPSPVMKSSASWAGAPWGSCTRHGITTSVGRRP